MKDQYRLESLANDQLLASLSELVAKDRIVTAELLAHLAECDERRLHLDLGFPSLFAYCTESLGFCEATAWRRIAAARVCRRFPENVGASATHLKLDGPGVHVDCLTLGEDLCKSMEDYAVVLDDDKEPAALGFNTTLSVDPRSPCKRWVRAFWARFRPIGFKDPGGTLKGHELWLKLGESSYGIPT